MTTRPHLNLLHLLGDEFDLLVEVILWGRYVLLHVIPSTDVNDLEVKANVVFCAGLIYYIWIFLLIYRLEPNWTVFSLKILFEMNEKAKKAGVVSFGCGEMYFMHVALDIGHGKYLHIIVLTSYTLPWA